jgi:hypothetical protein
MKELFTFLIGAQFLIQLVPFGRRVCEVPVRVSLLEWQRKTRRGRFIRMN